MFNYETEKIVKFQKYIGDEMRDGGRRVQW